MTMIPIDMQSDQAQRTFLVKASALHLRLQANPNT
jgi:hypothetical protein